MGMAFKGRKYVCERKNQEYTPRINSDVMSETRPTGLL
jgi:hypothetical protein